MVCSKVGKKNVSENNVKKIIYGGTYMLTVYFYLFMYLCI